MTEALMYEDKMPPHNDDAEDSVIAAIMIDQDAINIVASILQPEHFYSDRNQIAYKACLSLYHRNEAIDQITLAQELGSELESMGGGKWIANLVNYLPTTVHTKYYANIVLQTAYQRAMIEVGDQIRAKAFDETQPKELIANCMKMILDMRPPGKQSLFSPEEMPDYAMSMLSARYAGQGANLPFGFLDLDRETGGMRNGNLIIVGARPSIGKSTFVQQVARHLTATKRVLLCSAEMSLDEYIDRELVANTGISIQKISTATLTEDEGRDVQYVISHMSKIMPYIQSGNLTTNEIEFAAKEVAIRTGLDMIIVDYIQLLADSQGSSLNERVSFITRRLKQIALELDVPVLAVSQLNRELERRDDKHPHLSDLRDSGSIEQDADMVILLYRSGAYYNNEFDWKQSSLGRGGQPFEPNILEVGVAKHRQRGTGNRAIKLGWNEKNRQFRDLYSGS